MLTMGALLMVASCTAPVSKKSAPALQSNSALIGAIKAGDVQKVQALLEQGSDPNMTDSAGRPAITLIAQAPVVGRMHGMPTHGPEQQIDKHKNHREIVTLLVQHGAKVNVKDADGWTPLMQAKACEETELVSFLLHSGAVH